MSTHVKNIPPQAGISNLKSQISMSAPVKDRPPRAMEARRSAALEGRRSVAGGTSPRLQWNNNIEPQRGGGRNQRPSGAHAMVTALSGGWRPRLLTSAPPGRNVAAGPRTGRSSPTNPNPKRKRGPRTNRPPQPSRNRHPEERSDEGSAPTSRQTFTTTRPDSSSLRSSE